MQAAKQPVESAQRSLVKSIGIPGEEEFLHQDEKKAPEKIKFARCIILGSLAPELGPESFFAEIGAPNLRTAWDIQSITVSYIPYFGTADVLPGRNEYSLLVETQAGTTPANVDQIPVKLPFEGSPNFNTKIEGRKTIVLEIFSPIRVAMAQQLSLTFTFINGLECTNGQVMVMNEPLVTIVYSQGYPIF